MATCCSQLTGAKEKEKDSIRYFCNAEGIANSGSAGKLGSQNDDAFIKLLYLALTNVMKKWTMPTSIKLFISDYT
jgi:hypothetical protein